MNTIAQANADSDLYRTLENSVEMVNPYVYSLDVNMGSVAPHNRQSVTKTVPANTVAEFEVPRSGLWKGVHMALTLTASAQPLVVGKYLPLTTFSAIELRTRSSLIQRLVPQEIIEFANEASYATNELLVAAECLRKAANNITTTAAVTYYIPLPFACHARSNHYLDTQITEPLLLRVYMNPDSASVPGGATLTRSVEMVYDFLSLSEGMKAQYKAALNKNGDRGVARLMWNSVQESKDAGGVVAAGASISHDIQVRYPVFKIIVDVTLAAATNPEWWLNPIANTGAGALAQIELLSSGVSIRTWKASELRLEASMPPKHRIGQAAVESYAITFNQADSPADQTGFLSFRHLTSPQLRLTMAVASTAETKYFFTYQYYTEEAVEPTDGNIKITTLS